MSGAAQCGVCESADLGPGMFTHLLDKHKAMIPAFREWDAEQVAASSSIAVEHAEDIEARAARFVEMLGMTPVILDAVGADGRPARDPVTMRVSPAYGWVWCGMCQHATREFEIGKHFTDRPHTALFGEDVVRFEVRNPSPDTNFWGTSS